MNQDMASLGPEPAGLSVWPASASGPDQPASSLHLAFGMFDGVHLGHQQLIRQTLKAAGYHTPAIAGALTFDPHPSRILRPDNPTRLILPLEMRIQKLLGLGLDRVYVQAFTAELALTPPEAFVERLLTVFPGLSSLHVGANFRFGAKRRGDPGLLQSMGGAGGFAVGVLEREHYAGSPVSSSRIREALASGDIDLANALLGQPYTVQGRVGEGRRIGRQLGFPTVNLLWDPETRPRFGVYCARLSRAGQGHWEEGVANYGMRPTLGEGDTPLLEVHLLDPREVPSSGDPVEVELLGFLRPEHTFPSLSALREQIFQDVEQARKGFKARSLGPPPR